MELSGWSLMCLKATPTSHLLQLSFDFGDYWMQSLRHANHTTKFEFTNSSLNANYDALATLQDSGYNYYYYGGWYT